MNHYTIGILSHNISMRFSSGPQPDSSLDHNFHSFNEVLCTDVAPAGFLPTSQVGGWSLEQFRWGHCTQGEVAGTRDGELESNNMGIYR